MFIRMLCIFCWVLLSSYTHAFPSSIQVDSAYLYADSPQSYSVVHQFDNDRWTVVEKFSNHGFKEGEYWLRVNIRNTSQDIENIIYRFDYPLHDEVDFYVFNQQGELVTESMQGDMRDRSQHQVMDKHAAIKLVLNGGESKQILMRVASMNALVLSSSIYSQYEHEQNVHFEAIFSSLIYGILLAMALYNLGLAISLKDKANFSYVLYVSTFTAFLLTLSGDGYYYFWNEWPNFNRYLLPALSGFLIIPSLLFPYCLLKMEENVPVLAKLYKGLMILAGLFVLSIPLLGVAKSVVIINSLSAVLSIVMLVIGMYLTYKKVPLAGLYTLAWVFLLIGLSVLSVSSLGLMESNLLSRNAGLIGGVIEAVILSLALAQRISQERREKLKAVEQAVVSRKHFQELFDLAPIGIVRFDLKGRLVAMNPNFVSMMGYQNEQHALSEFKMVHNVITDHEENRKHLMHNENLLDKEITFRTIDDKLIPCSVSLHMYKGEEAEYIEAYITDIRERVESQNIRDLMEQERLTSIEQLVTGVAHEINTPLGVNITSVSHIEEILSEVDTEMQNRTLTRQKFLGFVDDTQQLLQIVTHNLNKMSNIVRRFKLVSMGKASKVNVNLKHVIEKSIHSHLRIEEDINIEVYCGDNINIDTYPAAWNIIIEQLIENSIVHGFDRNQHDKNIEIRVTPLESGSWRFDYQDNGRGLDEHVFEKAFKPFVTTKRSSVEHAGLGLYRIYNLVHRALKGDVSVSKGEGFHLAITFDARQLEIKQTA